LFQDNRFLVANKPAGLPVHPGRAGGKSVEDLFPAWRIGRNGPWLAHRLDQDTAGCLLIALKKTALLAAQKLFAENGVEKTYWAVVRGVPREASGMVDLPLGKVTLGRQWKMAPAADGAPAVTQWRVMGTADDLAWIEFRPRTGRTHQIRAHAALMGHAVLGDPIYGGGAGVLHLLARRIFLPLDPPVLAEAPAPAHMTEKLKACFNAEK
jgi:tRNA pseudouridine32 synthase/23S rRNA pseudouridine746 synthase